MHQELNSLLFKLEIEEIYINPKFEHEAKLWLGNSFNEKKEVQTNFINQEILKNKSFAAIVDNKSLLFYSKSFALKAKLTNKQQDLELVKAWNEFGTKWETNPINFNGYLENCFITLDTEKAYICNNGTVRAVKSNIPETLNITEHYNNSSVIISNKANTNRTITLTKNDIPGTLNTTKYYNIPDPDATCQNNTCIINKSKPNNPLSISFESSSKTASMYVTTIEYTCSIVGIAGNLLELPGGWIISLVNMGASIAHDPVGVAGAVVIGLGLQFVGVPLPISIPTAVTVTSFTKAYMEGETDYHNAIYATTNVATSTAIGYVSAKLAPNSSPAIPMVTSAAIGAANAYYHEKSPTDMALAGLSNAANTKYISSSIPKPIDPNFVTPQDQIRGETEAYSPTGVTPSTAEIARGLFQTPVMPDTPATTHSSPGAGVGGDYSGGYDGGGDYGSYDITPVRQPGQAEMATSPLGFVTATKELAVENFKSSAQSIFDRCWIGDREIHIGPRGGITAGGRAYKPKAGDIIKAIIGTGTAIFKLTSTNAEEVNEAPYTIDNDFSYTNSTLGNSDMMCDWVA